MDDLLIGLDDIDKTMDACIRVGRQYTKAFLTLAHCVEEISKYDTEPEARARAKETIALVKELLGPQ